MREKHPFDVGMKITSERRKSGSIIDNELNLARCVALQMVLLHSTVIAIQEGLSGEELGHPGPLTAHVGHGQCVLIDTLEGRGVLTVSDHKGCQSAACNTAPKQDSYSVPKSLEPGMDLASVQ